MQWLIFAHSFLKDQKPIRNKLILSGLTLFLLIFILQLTPVNTILIDLASMSYETIVGLSDPDELNEDVLLVDIYGLTPGQVDRGIDSLLLPASSTLAIHLCNIPGIRDYDPILRTWINEGIPVGDCDKIFLSPSVVPASEQTLFVADPNTFETRILGSHFGEIEIPFFEEKRINFDFFYPTIGFEALIDPENRELTDNRIVLLGNLQNHRALNMGDARRLQPGEMDPVQISAYILTNIRQEAYVSRVNWISIPLILLIAVGNFLILRLIYDRYIVLYWVSGYGLLAIESILFGFLAILFYNEFHIWLDFSGSLVILPTAILLGFMYEMYHYKRYREKTT